MFPRIYKNERINWPVNNKMSSLPNLLYSNYS